MGKLKAYLMAIDEQGQAYPADVLEIDKED